MPLERVKQEFKDISMSFETNPLNDDLIALKNSSAIARSIRNIVFTQPGEKFFNPDFGSRITESLFENMDEVSALAIRDEIEKYTQEMRNIAKQNHEVFRHELDRDDAVKIFSDLNEFYKIEIINDIEDSDQISAYKQGEFIKEPWFESMPDKMFNTLKKKLGWHLLITARRQK